MTDIPLPSDALVALGYTPREADFVRLVARHGGYFVMRQFCAAIGHGHGRMTVAFARKVVRRKDATVQTFCRATQVLHLAPRRIYRAAGVSPEPYRRRQRPAAAVTPRLMALDYVLDHPQFTFLATDDEPLTYLDRLGIDRLWLPQQRYVGHRARVPHLRYFVDGGPLAVAPSTTGADTVVFAFIDDGPHASVSIGRFVERYRGLFDRLSAWRVVFVTRDPRRVAAAERSVDRALATPTVSPYPHQALQTFEEYAHLRQTFERKQWSVLQKAGLDRLSVLRRAYIGPPWERLFGQWEQRGAAVLAAASAPPLGRTSRGAFEASVMVHSYAATQAVRGPQ